MKQQNDNRFLPKRGNIIIKHAPNWTSPWLPILVTIILWTFLVKVVDPVPVNYGLFNTLGTRGVGGLDANCKPLIDCKFYYLTYLSSFF